MRGFDYVGKRVLFAALTVFVAITLNFVLFRTLSGDAVSALRCRQCTAQFKEYQRAQLGLDQSKLEQYKLYDEQGTAVDENKRAAIVQQMEQMIYDNWVYTQLVEEQYIDAHTAEWDGMDPHLNAYAKMYWTRPHQVG